MLKTALSVKVRKLVAELRSVPTPYLTKRERARAVRANLRDYIRFLRNIL